VIILAFAGRAVTDLSRPGAPAAATPDTAPRGADDV